MEAYNTQCLVFSYLWQAARATSVSLKVELHLTWRRCCAFRLWCHFVANRFYIGSNTVVVMTVLCIRTPDVELRRLDLVWVSRVLKMCIIMHIFSTLDTQTKSNRLSSTSGVRMHNTVTAVTVQFCSHCKTLWVFWTWKQLQQHCRS